MLKLPIYLDNNATTPDGSQGIRSDDALIFSNILAMQPAVTTHFGWEAEEAVDYAREQVAKLIGADPKEIIFTAGATEADNLAMKGVL
jgi:cysteine desulfurase